MPVVHLAAVDTLKCQTFADDRIHIDLDRLVADAKQRDLTAVAHDGNELVERRGIARHLKTHIEAFGESLRAHNFVQIFLRRVYCRINTHFAGKLQPVIIYICNNDTTRAGIFADTRSNHANRTCAGNEYVLTNQREHQRGVRRVAEGVKKRNNILRQALVDDNDVGLRNTDIFGKRAVAINANTNGILAPLDIAGMAVTAMAAGNVPFARDALADMQPCHAFAERGDFADIFMTDGHGRLDMQLRPRVPVVDVYVRAADGSFVDFDKNLARAGFGNRHLP